MAKLIEIRFSESDQKVEIPPEGKVTIREAEIILLRYLFKLARAGTKNLNSAFEITDCLNQLDNLKDEDNSVSFTEQDINYLREGFSFSAGQRPEIMFSECLNLLKQLKQQK
jgi:hypothetical protein